MSTHSKVVKNKPLKCIECVNNQLIKHQHTYCINKLKRSKFFLFQFPAIIQINLKIIFEIKFMAYSIHGRIFDITQANSKGETIREKKENKKKTK